MGDQSGKPGGSALRRNLPGPAARARLKTGENASLPARGVAGARRHTPALAGRRKGVQARGGKKAERPDPEMPLHVLARLNAAEAFEPFLQTKYVGQKRFSLEGGEAVIPLLDEILASASRAGMDEVCIGMPHRGRLNVLANIVGKSYGQIFREFEGNIDPTTVQGSGDVKYHLG